MKNVELSIPDMQSTHCQSRVNSAIKDIDGVTIEKLEAGKLAVSLESNEVKQELLDAIEKAGYKVDGGDSEIASSCSTGCCG